MKGMPRLMTAQKAILSAQCSVLACATLLTVVLIVMPTYVFGSIYGTMSTTDGLLVIAPFLIYTKFAPAHALMRFVQEQTFAECIKSEPQWRLTPRWRNFWVAFSFFKCMCLAEVHVSIRTLVLLRFIRRSSGRDLTTRLRPPCVPPLPASHTADLFLAAGVLVRRPVGSTLPVRQESLGRGAGGASASLHAGLCGARNFHPLRRA